MSIVYIVSAPSGSGKSTLVNELFRVVRHLYFSISYTTRPPRGSEQNGKEYFFVAKQEFEAMIAADEFLEYANVFGNKPESITMLATDGPRPGSSCGLYWEIASESCWRAPSTVWPTKEPVKRK